MQLKIFQINAFIDESCKGNPAAICPLDEWIDDELMQDIAAENNLSETGFFVEEENGFYIRWFTPTAEVDLCGHATLAAAYVLYNFLDYLNEQIVFNSRSGKLNISKNDDLITLDFPSDSIQQIALSDELTSACDVKPIETFRGASDYSLVFENQGIIANMSPDIADLNNIDTRGIIVTALGTKSDFVSRFFAPRIGIDEDPVTGAAHTTMTPYWSQRLNKTNMTAYQLSNRGGFLNCAISGDRVQISGKAKAYLVGDIFLEV